MGCFPSEVYTASKQCRALALVKHRQARAEWCTASSSLECSHWRRRNARNLRPVGELAGARHEQVIAVLQCCTQQAATAAHTRRKWAANAARRRPGSCPACLGHPSKHLEAPVQSNQISQSWLARCTGASRSSARCRCGKYSAEVTPGVCTCVEYAKYINVSLHISG